MGILMASVWWLPYPTEKNMSSSVWMMKFPIYGKTNNPNVPNHQPVMNPCHQ
jgi:hypothetical protein